MSFRHIYSVPFKMLTNLVKERGEDRLRLMPPYREHLSQSFGRFFMRVGLPEDIPKDDSLYIKRECVECGETVSKNANYCENCGKAQN